MSDDDSNCEDFATSGMMKTIQTMQDTGIFCHPAHFHSFQQVTFHLLSSLRKCARCQERLKTFGNAQVVCVACGAMAHRSCALLSQQWNEPCPVNVTRVVNAKEDSQTRTRNAARNVSLLDLDDACGEKDNPLIVDSKDNEIQALKRPFGALSSVKDAIGKTLSFGQLNPKQNAVNNESNVLHHTSHQFSSVARALQENIMEHFRKRASNESNDDDNDDDSYIDITTGESPKQSTVNDRIGTAAVVGGIAGGVAGLAFAAGPAIAMAGAVGVFAESSVSMGVLVASMATGSMTARQIQERIEERRVLTMGEEGISQKIMLVRPSIVIDPIWETITAEAYASRPKDTSANFDMARKSLFFNDLVLSRERYHRDIDIVKTAEEEISTDEKVLLLVSRLLNDKSSLPGHVYRELVQAFRNRCDDRESAAGRFRRDDAHAIIKHVTATLLQVRAEFSSSPHITERTASAVETLVFGQLYNLVWDEILVETAEKDEALKQKVKTFNLLQYEENGTHVFVSNEIPSKLEKNVSQSALDAVRQLPQCHTTADKLVNCVRFLEHISEHFTATDGRFLSTESLLQMVCQHLWICMSIHAAELHAEVTFLEEFARDEQLLRGREGYALVTLQAALHFLDSSPDLDYVFNSDEEDEDMFESIPADVS